MPALLRHAADLLGRDSVLVQSIRPAYRSVLRAVYGRSGMPWSLNGTPVRIDPQYREDMGQVYDPSVVRWLQPQVRPRQVVWNVGANLGVYALQLAHWVGPTGRVVAVEPNPHACQALARHLTWSGVSDRVVVVPAAVGATIGEATLYVDGASPLSALGRPNPLVAAPQSVTVPVTTLDALLRAHPMPDWIVMDVEGFELHALAGGATLFRERGHRLGVVLELHPNLWAGLGQDGGTLDRWLAAQGRTVLPLRGEGDVHEAHGIVALVPG